MKKILTISPGSTSTKAGLFTPEGKIDEISVPVEQEYARKNVVQEYAYRRDLLKRFLEKIDLSDLAAVVGRGAPLKPMEGGVYKITPKLLSDLRECRYSNHASNLGGLLAHYFGELYKVPAWIIDPVSVDEFDEISRISGVPEIRRRSRSHALNIKATARKWCDEYGEVLEKENFVVAHLGGGISICALKMGKIRDVNDGLLGMGPFSPERAGALPISGLLDLAFSGDYTRKELDHYLSRECGLKGYLKTNDAREVVRRIQEGDKYAQLIMDAMIYQIEKEIGAMLAACHFVVKAVLITGGLAHCLYITRRLQDHFSMFNIHIIPGENELEAMADGGFRALKGDIPVQDYM
ncbi:MAG: butyrate kinase [Candidatus Neomarinimicrobiota bacterium]|nr:butyrate kinase [Candidatus Neomarinimicrobiota bacterium]RKY47803.1 MAG: butyrate kinase [Candidatus Neomarinimicrobiota bacterium]